MSLTILDQIQAEIFSRLEDMVDNETDYQIAIAEVVQPTRSGGFTPKDRQILLVQGEDERVNELDIPGNPPGIARRQMFNVRVHLMPDELSGEDVVNTAAADVIKAITTPNSAWHTFGGLAIDCEIGKFEYVNFDGGIDGVNIPLMVTYRVSEYSPYVSRV